jgi:protein-tyrosine kinase
VSIIEQAARRLEELRRGGIEVPFRQATPDGATPPTVPNLAVRRLDEVRPPAPDDAQAALHSMLRPERALSRDQSKQVQIDLSRLASVGYVTPHESRAQIAQEFRVIKRPLLINIHGKGAAPVERANLVMVTSSLPGEGKTFVAINLAISMAMELDKTVLLVDADVARPSILPRLGLPPSPGLLDMLENSSASVSDVLLRTNIEKLSILPAGAPRSHATELLASASMSALLDDLATRYSDRVVVFDAPPLLPSTESRVLATQMGQVIMVVEAERTPLKTVTQALSTIESCPVVMPLLNKASRSEVGFYYGYYGPVQE